LPSKLSVLVVSRGHEFDRNAFSDMFAALELPDQLVETTQVEHPAAGIVLRPGNVDPYDVILFYDMSGIPGMNQPDGSDDKGQPSTDYSDSILGLLEVGKGIILLNHATVSWPHWPLWQSITGSPFMLQAGVLNGIETPGSGYRGGHGPHPNPTFSLQPQGQHPVLNDLQAGFEMTDELYLKTRAFEADVVPLLRADYRFEADLFTPPPMASRAEQDNWNHPPGSDLVVWANSCQASPVIVCELGDGREAFNNSGFRRLIGNSIAWVASEDARSWARSRDNS
jgi:hypothetical protein